MSIFYVLILALLPSSSFPQAACTAERYRIVPIPILPTSVNDMGSVAGSTARHKAAVWTKEKNVLELQIPRGFSIAEATGINRKGDVIGFVTDASSSKRRAFLYHAGRTFLLAGDQAKAWAINDAAVIAGEAVLRGKPVSAPVLWKASSVRALGGCCGGTALTLNNRGEVAGQVYDPQGNYSAFRWDGKQGLQRLGQGAAYSSAVTMNDSGHIVVWDQNGHSAYLYADGKPTPLKLSSKYPSRPRAMNDCDAIVGSYGLFADVERAFVWDSIHGFRDLNDLVPTDSGWKFEAATGINNRGEIVGWGDFKHQDDQGFLLIPEP